MTTRKHVRDQIIGRTMSAGIDPTVYGIARAKMMIKIVQRGIDCADTIAAIVRAKDSADPASQEIANRLMSNKEFVKAMATAVESILADVKKIAAAQPTAAKADPAAPVPFPDDETTNKQVGPDYEESNSPNNQNDPKKGSGLPGADSITTLPPGFPSGWPGLNREWPAVEPKRALDTVTGSYTVEAMTRDLATQNATAAKLARSVGADAAATRVANAPLVPAWTSPVWSNEARAAFRARAASDGWAAAHMSGNVPEIEQYFRAEGE